MNDLTLITHHNVLSRLNFDPSYNLCEIAESSTTFQLANNVQKLH